LRENERLLCGLTGISQQSNYDIRAKAFRPGREGLVSVFLTVVVCFQSGDEMHQRIAQPFVSKY